MNCTPKVFCLTFGVQFILAHSCGFRPDGKGAVRMVRPHPQATTRLSRYAPLLECLIPFPALIKPDYHPLVGRISGGKNGTGFGKMPLFIVIGF